MKYTKEELIEFLKGLKSPSPSYVKTHYEFNAKKRAILRLLKEKT